MVSERCLKVSGIIFPKTLFIHCTIVVSRDSIYEIIHSTLQLGTLISLVLKQIFLKYSSKENTFTAKYHYN